MAQSLEQLFAAGAQPRLLVDGFRFTEGPAADANGDIYFVDIGSNRIHFWDVTKQELPSIREDSGGGDGLALIITTFESVYSDVILAGMRTPEMVEENVRICEETAGRIDLADLHAKFL